MMCGADSIDDVNLRAAGTPVGVLDAVHAPSTLGIFLRELTFGPANLPAFGTKKVIGVRIAQGDEFCAAPGGGDRERYTDLHHR